MNVEQVQTNVCGQETEPNAQPARTSPRWRSSSAWLLACCGGGALPIVAVLAWGYWEFGSLANTLAYLNGERLLVNPIALSCGEGRPGEMRELSFTIENCTRDEVQILSNTSTCSCVSTDRLPLKVPAGATHKMTVKVGFGRKTGGFEHQVSYYTDSEYLPAFMIEIRGKVIADEKSNVAQ